MAKYRIGITEAGDAGLDLSWVDKLNDVDGAVVITKQITDSFINAALTNQEKLIIHLTCTGYGGKCIEPNVPCVQDEIVALERLIQSGFTKEKVVIRIDPIIPTAYGLGVAETVFKIFINHGFNRFRVSLIDMYPHVRKRFIEAGIKPPYGNFYFSPNQRQKMETDYMLESIRRYWEISTFHNSVNDCLRIECCAEPELTKAIQCGCISAYDLNLLGISDESVDSIGYQRKNCLCYSGKTELLVSKHPCAHECLYCYWKDR